VFPVAPVSLLDKILDSTDDEHPLVLEGVESTNFECLLWIIYPRALPIYLSTSLPTRFSSVLGQCKATTMQDWTAILDLVSRWKFANIWDLAICELGAFEMDPVEKIELQHRYHIKRQWAYGAYIALCSCPHALDVIEGRQLRIETTVSVVFAR
jgi:hypothetical protein